MEKLSERLNRECDKKLKHGNTRQGDCVSVDHYISAVPGRLGNKFGCEKQGYACDTIFVDHTTYKIFNFCQYSTTAFKIVTNKNKLELAKQEGFEIKSYHSDNSIFVANEFKVDCERLDQTIDFSGVGAQH